MKEPVAGRVKTRLAGHLGDARAVAFFRHAMRSVVSRIAHSTRWQTYLAVTPDSSIFRGGFPNSVGPLVVHQFAQGGGNLGQRMQRVFDWMPAGPVVIVGSDVPLITSRHLKDAFRKLGRSDVVVGPSPDGGYWLIGMRRTPRVLRAFDGVRWSSADTLSDTLSNVADREVSRVEELADVDVIDDYKRLGAFAVRRILPVGGAS